MKSSEKVGLKSKPQQQTGMGLQSHEKFRESWTEVQAPTTKRGWDFSPIENSGKVGLKSKPLL